MKGYNSDYNNIGKRTEGIVNGIDYNIAGSHSVGRVDNVITVINAHALHEHGIPYTVIRNYRNGKLSSERYYNNNGDAYLDIDYNNHGNSKMHPNVPHEHKIWFDKNGKMHREHNDGGIK